MLGPTVDDIKGYLTNSDLANKIVCSDNTLCETLARFVTVGGLDSQINPTGTAEVKTLWWIDYSDTDDVFTYKVAPFDINLNPITYEAYEQYFIDKEKSGVIYNDANKIIWVRAEDGSYNAQYNEYSKYADYMMNNIPKILKVN